MAARGGELSVAVKLANRAGATPSPTLPTRGRVLDRAWGTIEHQPPGDTSPLVGEAGRGGRHGQPAAQVRHP